MIVYDTSKPAGDPKRLLDVSRLKDLGFKPKTTLEEGIAKTTKWYLENPDSDLGQYNIFKQN